MKINLNSLYPSETPADPMLTEAQTHAVFVVIPRFNMTTLTTMIEVMRIANYLSSQPLFTWQITSFDGPEITASNGMKLSDLTPVDDLVDADTVFVLGSWGAEHYDNKSTVSWLRKTARAGVQICAVEMGSYVVAKTGLLKGKPATTHWSWVPGFQEKYSDINVVEQIFTIDNKIMTCAGGLAGVDLMLRLIELSHGAGLSGEIADQMLHHPVRIDTTPQRHTMGQGTETMVPVVREAVSLMERNIEDPISVPEIAKTLGVSQRQLERLFKRHIGCTAVQFGLLMRLQNARVLLITTDLSIREIATASGFNTLSHFAYSFGKFFGRRPSEYREAWPQEDSAPSWPGTLSDFLSSLKSKQPGPLLR